LCGVVAVAESSFGGDGFSIASAIERIQLHGNGNGLIAVRTLEPVFGIGAAGEEQKEEEQEYPIQKEVGMN
jgi:hypothetical protein